MSLTYSIAFTKSAQKQVNKLDKPTQKKIVQTLETLKENPYSMPHVKPLAGTSGDTYRLRIGQLRVIYEVHNDQLLIMVLKIGPRGDIYKK